MIILYLFRVTQFNYITFLGYELYVFIYEV